MKSEAASTPMPSSAVSTPPWDRVDVIFLAAALAVQLALGLWRLDLPSLWHDELVHVFVAREIAASGRPLLPSGVFYPSSLLYNYLLGAAVRLFGDGAFAVRGLTVVTSVAVIAANYALLRALLGRGAAALATALLIASPWHLAWARQARMYELQALTYLLFLYTLWRVWHAPGRKEAIPWAVAATAAYFAGVFTSFHSILYLGVPGAFAVYHLVGQRFERPAPWLATLAACTAAGLITLAGLLINPNPTDQAAVFETGLGGTLPDPQRLDRLLYFRYLYANHSLGYLLLALLGTGVLVYQHGRRGLYLALAFWVPVLILTWLIGYRRPRFMYFAFPFYLTLSAAGLMVCVQGALRSARSPRHFVLGALCILFLFRFAISQTRLIEDTLRTAGGASENLALRMPEWKAPCAWVKANQEGHAILTTTALPVLYYVGRMDNWFPNRYHAWEVQESGLPGLASLEELQEFIHAHPQGYFIAERSRFEMWSGHRDLANQLGAEHAWVRENMERVAEASSSDVTVYRWGPDTLAGPPPNAALDPTGPASQDGGP